MSATGLYAMVSLNILKKLKEIGVRKVMGATAADIVKVINREFVIILSVASVLGGLLGYFMTNKMMGILSKNKPADACLVNHFFVPDRSGHCGLQNGQHRLYEPGAYLTG
jgi:ABC-type antimicrobial peptide transport system permease subunit